ncbi:MAG: hypothetical protein J3Q66DRAFT_409993 [Benniella sp.]|nr:MAG: hypothetical protein J3Q66DRAFT_409993 [Benniella sp.]
MLFNLKIERGKDASNDLPLSLPADIRSNPVGESPDFIPEEDSFQLSGVQVVPDVDTMGYLVPLPPKHQPLTPQQIADTEHQGANAFFGLFAKDVFPGVELIGNNGVRDPAFEKLLKKQMQANKRKQKKRIRRQPKHASNKKSKDSTVKRVTKKSANTKSEGSTKHQKRQAAEDSGVVKGIPKALYGTLVISDGMLATAKVRSRR